MAPAGEMRIGQRYDFLPGQSIVNTIFSNRSERPVSFRNPSIPTLDRVIDRFQLRLNAYATATTREWWTRYLRGAASFRGVKMGDVRTAVHAWYKEERLREHLSVGQQKDLALMLLEEDYTEDKLAGVLFLQEILLPAGALDWRSDLPGSRAYSIRGISATGTSATGSASRYSEH
jgi:hypothetical protein